VLVPERVTDGLKPKKLYSATESHGDELRAAATAVPFGDIATALTATETSDPEKTDPQPEPVLGYPYTNAPKEPEELPRIHTSEFMTKSVFDDGIVDGFANRVPKPVALSHDHP
jgi:hypothetical protein